MQLILLLRVEVKNRDEKDRIFPDFVKELTRTYNSVSKCFEDKEFLIAPQYGSGYGGEEGRFGTEGWRIAKKWLNCNTELFAMGLGRC